MQFSFDRPCECDEGTALSRGQICFPQVHPMLVL